MENCPFCGAPGSYRESADGCCYVCGMMLPDSQATSKSTSVQLQAEASAAASTDIADAPPSNAATIEMQPPTFVPPLKDTVEPPAIKLIQPRNLSPEYARRVTAAWQATKSPFHNPQETLNSSSSTSTDPDKLSIGTRSVAGADDERSADYELKEVIGEGNMGTVWSARQASLDRHIAIKMPKQSAARSSLGREMFISEVVVTGQLDHPNIVPIYDLARDESGQLFYSMKRVEGRSWDQCMHEADRTRLDNVEILMKVCDAIRFAHDRGVIHRDIKPQNIMVGKYGEVSVMDWGIALRIDVHLRPPGSAKLNPSGTPAYMAPEMATGNAAELGPHTDVYLLGAVLYEIITGEPPHPAPDPSHDPIVQQNACLLLAARNVITPAKETGELVDIAYKAMATDISDRFQTVDDFQNAMRDYFSHSESIALADRGQEHLTNAIEAHNGVYEDYNKARFAFGEALELWSENSRARAGLSQATIAHAETALKRGDYALGLSLLDRANPTHTELAKKLSAAKRKSNRNRFAALASAVAAVSFLVLGIIVSSYFYKQTSDALLELEEKSGKLTDVQKSLETTAAKNAATQADLQKANQDLQSQRNEVEETKADLADLANDKKTADAELAAAKGDVTRAKAELEAQSRLTESAQEQAQEALYRSEIGRAAEEMQRNAFDNAGQIINEIKKLSKEESQANWELRHLMYLAEDPSISRFQIEGSPRVNAAAMSSDGKWIAAGADDKNLYLWWRPDAKQAAIALKPLTVDSPISAVVISDDGKLLIAAAGKEVKFWTLPEDGSVPQPVGESLQYSDSILSVDVSPSDTDVILTSSADSKAQIWSRRNPQKPTRILAGHIKPVRQARFSHDGSRVVTAGEDGSLRIWDAKSGRGQSFGAHRSAAYAVEFSPDDSFIVSGGRDRRLLLWTVPEINDLEASTKLITGQLQSLEDSSQGSSLNQLEEHTGAIRAVSFSPDGKTLYSASDDNTVGVWSIGPNFKDVKLVKSLRGHGGWVRSCAAAADGKHVLSGSFDGTVFLWDWPKYAFPRVLRPEAEQTIGEIRLTSAAASSDARWIASAAENGAVTMWDMADPLNPKSQLLREGHDWQATTAAYFSDGSRLLTSGGDNSTLIWDTQRGNQLLRMGGWNKSGGTGWRGVAAASHNGRLVATGSDEPKTIAKLWDAKSGLLVASLKAPQTAQANREEVAEATAIAFDPKDGTVFIGDQWGRGYVFDSSNGAFLKQFNGHDSKISAAAFLPNGRLLTASSDRRVVMWNIDGNETGPRLEREFAHNGRVVAMDVSSDGKLLMTAADSSDDDVVLRLWDMETGGLKHQLVRESLKQGRNPSDAEQAKPPVVRSVAFHPNQLHALVTVFDPNTVFDPSDRSKSPYQVGKWDWQNKEQAFEPQLSRLDDTSLAVYAPGRDASVLTVGGRGARLRLANKVVMSYRPQSRVQSVTFSPDNRLLACAGDDGSIKLWRLEGEHWVAERKLLGGHLGPVNSVAFHPTQSNILLTAGEDGTAKLWQRAADDWKSKAFGAENAGNGPMRQAVFSPAEENKPVIVATVADNSVKIWSEAGELLGTLDHGRPVQCVAVSPKQEWIVTGVGSEAWVWDAKTYKRSPMPPLGGHSAEITSLAFSPEDGQRLFTAARDFNVKLWDTKPWSVAAKVGEGQLGNAEQAIPPVSRELLTLEQHTDSVVSVCFFASKTYPSLLTAGADGQTILWPSTVRTAK